MENARGGRGHALRVPEDKNRPARVRVVPDYAHLMTVEQFKKDCEDRCLIDSDGSGHFVKDGIMFEEYLSCADVAKGIIPKDVTHVAWFNK